MEILQEKYYLLLEQHDLHNKEGGVVSKKVNSSLVV